MGKMWHVETFNSRGKPGEMEAILQRTLRYWRSRGFNVKVFVTQYSLGPAEFWLCTEMESFGALDRWPEMATGEEEGRQLMGELLGMAQGFRASVIKELEA
jgi:hypothetical protein